MRNKNSERKKAVAEFDFDKYLNLKKAGRLKLLQRMVENLDAETRKKFFAGLLPYVLSDDDLTKEAFKYNTGKQSAPKPYVVELSAKEKEMISQIADYFHELQHIVDLDDLLLNP